MKKFILDLIKEGTCIYCDTGTQYFRGNTPVALVEYMVMTKILEDAKGANAKVIKEVQKMASKMTVEEIEENCNELASKIAEMLEV